MPAKAGDIATAADFLTGGKDGFTSGVAIKAKPGSVDFFGLTKLSFSVKGSDKADLALTIPALSATPSVKFDVDLGDVKIGVDKMDFKAAGLVTETSWTLAADKNFKAGLKFNAGAKGGGAAIVKEASVTYKLPDVVINAKLADPAASERKLGVNFGLAPAADVGLGLKLDDLLGDKRTLGAAVEYKTSAMFFGLSFEKLVLGAPAQPPITVSASYSEIADVVVGGKVKVDEKGQSPEVGVEYTGVKDLTLNVAATELLGTPKATLQCKYSMGKSSVTLSATSAKTLGLSLEIA